MRLSEGVSRAGRSELTLTRASSPRGVEETDRPWLREASRSRAMPPEICTRRLSGAEKSTGEPSRLQWPSPSLTPVQPYLATARAFRWVLATILIIIWGAGVVAGGVEDEMTYQSEATIWAVRAAPALSVTDPNDPNIATIHTAAAQQADVLKQLLQTRSFLADVVARTSLKEAFDRATNQDRYLDDIRKRFHVETLGTSLIRVSFAAHDPKTPSELVNAALAVRAERLQQSREQSSAALRLLYQRQIEFAQQQAVDAQKAVDDSNKSHPAPLAEADQHVLAQLRLDLDFALVRLSDLKANAERASLAPALLEVSGVEFQIVDQPRVETNPSGGERSAITIGTVALAAGAALGTLLVLVATLLGVRGSRAASAEAEPLTDHVHPGPRRVEITSSIGR